MLAIRRTFEIITEESAAQGDAERRGWFDPRGPWESEDRPEPEIVSFRDLIDLIRRCEMSCEPLAPIGDLSHVWGTEYAENDGTRDFYEKGETRNVSIHFAGDNRGRRWWSLALRAAQA